jgi:chromosome segregation protein
LELERLTREDQRAPSAARAEPGAGGRKEHKKASIRRRRWNKLAGDLADCRRSRNAIAEEHSALRAQLAGAEERCRSEKASAARLEAQIRQLAERREQLSRELERMGVERARLLADNIELDQRAGQLAGETAGSGGASGAILRGSGRRTHGAGGAG